MALLSLVIALLIEKYYHGHSLSKQHKIRNSTWFEHLQSQLTSILEGQSWFKGWLSEAIIILLPSLVVYAGFSWLGDELGYHDNLIGSLVLLAIAVFILVHSLGPETPRKSLAGYYKSRASHDEQGAFESAKAFVGNDEAVESVEEFDREVARTIFLHTQTRYFSVVIWFVILGPAGALLYRLSHWYQEKNENGAFATNLNKVLEWIPARVSALAYLLAGDMSNGVSKIKKSFFDFDVAGLLLVKDAGQGSMGFYETDDKRGQSRCALKLSERTGVVIFAFVAIVSLLGWGLY